MLDERDRIIALLLRYGVRHASLFGSYARGEQRPDRAIDLLLDMPSGTCLVDLSRLALALEDELGRPVDLVTLRAALHPLIQERVRREERVLL